ncbi:MAG: glutathione synthase/RimK-type ligase-like ATP-grasp enzyme [Planctomycetota bacterium]|jgi:glutathione synthase/RimK-type ligase-like ATP-grasp enzyme
MIDVAVATSVPTPSFELQSQGLMDALASKGVEAQRYLWADVSGAPAPPLPARMTLLWSLYESDVRTDRFQHWAEHAGSESQLVNPFDAVRRSRDKKYLTDLDEAGIPTVPSMWCETRGSTVEFLTARVDWKAFVLKSARGGSVLRFDRDECEIAQRHMAEIDGDALLQPYLSQVAQEGVLAMHYIGGEFSHAGRHFPGGQNWRTQAGESRIERAEVNGSQLEIADAAVSLLAGDCSFARVDLIRDIDGPPSVIQLETAGCQMGLDLIEDAADRLVECLIRQLG